MSDENVWRELALSYRDTADTYKMLYESAAAEREMLRQMIKNEKVPAGCPDPRD